MTRGRAFVPFLVALVSLIVLGCSASTSGEEETGTVEQGLGSISVNRSRSTFTAPASIRVSWSGLPNKQTVWVALAPAGSPATTYGPWVWAGRRGSHTFTNVNAGTWVARALDGYTILTESPSFTVTSNGPPSVTAAATGATTARVTYQNMPGDGDWIALAAPSAPANAYVAWAYTGDGAAGSLQFSNLPSGTFVARAYTKNDFTIIAQSAPFSVGASQPSVSTNASSYTDRQSITVNWSNLTGNATDWIAISDAGSPTTSYLRWVYTNGAATGSTTFTAMAAGSYVARAYVENSLVMVAESPAFNVTAVVGTVSTDASSYTAPATVTVSFTNLPGFAHDWITLAPDGSSSTTYGTWLYTGGAANGSVVFTGVAPGNYVARAFQNDSLELLATSPSFTVAP